MTLDICRHCGEAIEAGYAACWKCGTHLDGTPPDPDFIPDALPRPPSDLPAPRQLDCLRCATPMQPVGRMRFHEGTRAWPFLFGDIGELFVNREVFDAYGCGRCGKVEFFLIAGDSDVDQR
jgi:hypothetical protein